MRICVMGDCSNSPEDGRNMCDDCIDRETHEEYVKEMNEDNSRYPEELEED